MDYVFRSLDHPEANGRKPVAGEESFPMWFTTEDRGKVTVKLGRAAFVNTAACIIRGLADDPVLHREVMDAAGDVNVENFMKLDTRKRE